MAAVMSIESELIACHECDRLHRVRVLKYGESAKCTRCGATMTDLPPRTIPLFKLESVAMGRPDRANARVQPMFAMGHNRKSRGGSN